MKEATAKLLDKADRSIGAAESSLANGHIESAANRAYYAMFYIAEALLNQRGLQFRKHGGVHSAFGKQFAKNKLLDAKYHQWLLAAFNKRIAADYGMDIELSASQVQEMVGQAFDFLQTARTFLSSEE